MHLRTLVVATALLGAAPLAAQETARITPVDGRVAIWNLVGRAQLVRGSGTDVEVIVTRQGADGSRLRLETGALDGSGTLRIRYPGRSIQLPGVYRREFGGVGSWSTSSMTAVDAHGRFYDRWSRRGESVRVSNDGELEAGADLLIRVPPSVDVSLHVAVGGVSLRGVSTDRLLISTGSGRVTAEQTRGDLRIDTGSGSVSVAAHSGNLDIDTGSGAVTASDVREARVVRIDTGSGSVSVDGCVASRSLTIDTGSGRVDARRVGAPAMKIDTGSGSVQLGLASRVDDLLVDTGSGGVTLDVPEGFGATLDLSSGSGGVRAEVPVREIARDEDALRGTMGDGRGRVRVDTGSGRILLRGPTRL